MKQTLTTALLKLNGSMKTSCLTYATLNRRAELKAYLRALVQAGIIFKETEPLLIAYFESRAKMIKYET